MKTNTNSRALRGVATCILMLTGLAGCATETNEDVAGASASEISDSCVSDGQCIEFEDRALILPESEDSRRGLSSFLSLGENQYRISGRDAVLGELEVGRPFFRAHRDGRLIVGKIIASTVSAPGQRTITIRPTRLDEVIREMNIDQDVNFVCSQSPDGEMECDVADPSAPPPPGAESTSGFGLSDCTVDLLDNDYAYAGLEECHIRFPMTFHTTMKWGGLRPKEVSLWAELDVDAEVLAVLEARASYNRAPAPTTLVSQTVSFSIGVIPFYVEAGLIAGYEIDFDATARIETGFACEGTIRVGVEYERGSGFSSIRENNVACEATRPTLNLSGGGYARAYAGPFIEVGIGANNILGAGIEGTLPLYLEGDLSFRRMACMSYEAGVSADVDAELDLLFTETSRDLWNRDFPLAEGSRCMFPTADVTLGGPDTGHGPVLGGDWTLEGVGF